MQNFLWNVDIPIEIPGGRGVQTFVVDQPDYRSAVDQALAEAMCTEARAHRRGAALLIEQIAQITAVPWRPLDSLL